MLARLAAIALTVTAVGMGPSALVGAAHAVPGDIGFEDYQYGPGMSSDRFLDPNLAPTASKPQSKLWFAQGAWWGALQVPDTTTITIHAYSASTHTWIDTGVVIDDRDEPTHADVLWDEGGQRLYVATAGRDRSVHGIRVLRFRYDAEQKKYLDDPGLPTGELTTRGVEAAVIAKDTTGRLWVAYTASAGTGRAVRVLAIDTHQTGLPDKFTPSVGGIPLDGTSITKDDIASIISHDGGVSLVWSNQNADAEGNTAFFVARHPDSAAPTEGWTGSQKVFSGPRVADDHISLTSAEGGPDGRVYAMVKSSAGDSGTASPNEGLVWLLVRQPDGTWEKYVHSTVKEDVTRPIVLLEPGAGLLHVFATSPVEGGVIYHKSTPMNAISFGSGRGDAFIKLANHPAINNATSSKQNVTAASGVMVLASDQTTGSYAHNYVPRTAPSAGFTWTPQSGPAPLEVRFTDTSAITGGAPTSWLWDFGDGATSTQQHPTHTFTTQGAYPVTLTVTNAAGSSSKTLTLTLTPTVNVAKPVASFTYTPQSGRAPLEVRFTDTSAATGGAPTSWLWNFGDGTTSTQQHPTHTFAVGGSYAVSVRVENLSGTSTVQKTITIALHPQTPVVVLDAATVVTTGPPGVDGTWHTSTERTEVAGYEVQVDAIKPSRRARWSSRTVLTTKQEVQVSADAGSTYCLRVRATNIAGDVGAWSGTRCAAVPLDDRDLARRGAWREASGAGNYSGTALVARARGAKLVRTVTGKQVSLLVTKRSDGGRVLIYRGDRLVRRMSLKASSTRHMQVLISSTKRVTTARYTIVVVSQGRPVIIDGMVVSRG